MNTNTRRPPGTAALRAGRYSGRNQIYLVTTCTRDRYPWFADLYSGRKVVNSIRYQDDCGHTVTLAFVVMPDHLHWLLQLCGNRTLSVCVQNVKAFSSREVNLLMQRQGPVWQKGFHDHGLRSEEDVVSIARYVVANPIRAGLVRTFGKYSLWDAIWL
jgi:REP element-mobilizing transposase RayT